MELHLTYKELCLYLGQGVERRWLPIQLAAQRIFDEDLGEAMILQGCVQSNVRRVRSV